MFTTILFFTIIVCVYYYFSYKFNYWHRKGVNSLNASIPFGNIKDIILIKRSYAEVFTNIYNKINGPFGGIYFGTTPVLFIKDPDLIKDILIKKFDHFQNRGMYFDEENEPISAHLFRIENEKWKNLRYKLSPAFSSGVLKRSFDIMFKYSEDLRNILHQYDNGSDVNFSALIPKYTTDVITSIGFGIDASCLSGDESIFQYFANDFKQLSKLKKVVQQCILFIPEIIYFLKLRHQSVKTEKLFINIVQKMLKLSEENKTEHTNYLQLLVQLKNEGYFHNNKGLNDELNKISAQAYVYFMAGLETSNLSLCYTLYFLAKFPIIQNKLHREIDICLNNFNGNLNYESVAEMKYLDAVISESLRLRPPLSVLNRICNKMYTIPNTNIQIEKGIKILISVLDIHMDSKYYENPTEFIPERFINKETIPNCCYLPFGDGPRNCIGLRQGRLQTKIGLLSVLRDHKIEICDSTCEPNLPLPGALLFVPEKPIILKLIKKVQ